MRISAPFQIAGKLRGTLTDNGSKQVEITYLAVISNLDKLLANQTAGKPKVLLSNAWHFHLRLINLKSVLVNGDMRIISTCKVLNFGSKVGLSFQVLEVCAVSLIYTNKLMQSSSIVGVLVCPQRPNLWCIQ